MEDVFKTTPWEHIGGWSHMNGETTVEISTQNFSFEIVFPKSVRFDQASKYAEFIRAMPLLYEASKELLKTVVPVPIENSGKVYRLTDALKACGVSAKDL